jgi:hypothetical protein
VLYRLDPFTSPLFAIPFFFASLFIALTATLTLIGFYGRVWFRQGVIYLQHINIALRQGALISLAVCATFTLSTYRILTWWTAVLVALAIGLVEVYFAARD